MNKDTNLRSFIKGISYRIIGTLTTVLIVYIFFGKLDLAIAAGVVETISKIALFWFHERLWLKIKWGKKKIIPFNIWFTGLPLSGKTTIADKVFNELIKLDIAIERIDSKDVRDIFPNVGFNRDDRKNHIRRVAHLIRTLQNNYISTVASFVSPYEESRKEIKHMIKNTLIIYVKTNIETCKKRDYKGVYQKAMNGEILNFTGISDVYEEPKNPDIIIDTDELNVNEAKKLIIKEIRKRYIK